MHKAVSFLDCIRAGYPLSSYRSKSQETSKDRCQYCFGRQHNNSHNLDHRICFRPFPASLPTSGIHDSSRSFSLRNLPTLVALGIISTWLKKAAPLHPLLVHLRKRIGIKIRMSLLRSLQTNCRSIRPQPPLTAMGNRPFRCRSDVA